MTAVKICGLKTPADIQIVNAVQPDFAGFVLAGGRHHVTPQALRTLIGKLDPRIAKVAVVLEPNFDELAVIADVIDVVQLHRVRPAKEIQKLHDMGFAVFGRIDAQHPQTCADFALLDAGDGSGKTLNWQALPKSNAPLMLAGGLDAGNVETAIKMAQPAIVDASSRLETNGQKDKQKVAAFVAAVRRANAQPAAMTAENM